MTTHESGTVVRCGSIIDETTVANSLQCPELFVDLLLVYSLALPFLLLLLFQTLFSPRRTT